jgi:hypothetical protein
MMRMRGSVHGIGALASALAHPKREAEGGPTSPPIDPAKITTPRAYEAMLRDLGFSRAFAAKATAQGFRAAHSDSDQTSDDATKAALARMRSAAQNLNRKT